MFIARQWILAHKRLLVWCGLSTICTVSVASGFFAIPCAVVFGYAMYRWTLVLGLYALTLTLSAAAIWSFSPSLMEAPVGILGVLGLPGLAALAWTLLAPKLEQAGSEGFGTVATARRQQLTRQEGGLVLGRLQGELLRYGGEGHAIVIGPTGSGKTTSVLIPTLLSDGPAVSRIVHDPKNELYEKTAPWLRTHSRVVRLCPTAEDSDQYNPLAAIAWKTPAEARGVQLVAEMLTSDGRHVDGRNVHFQEVSSVILAGALTHGWHSGRAQSLGSLHDLLYLPITELATDMSKDGHNLCQHAAQTLADLRGDELSGMVSTMRRATALYADPVVSRMVEGSSFTLDALRNGDTPTTVFLSTPFSDQQRCTPIMRLLLRQFLDHATQQLSGWTYGLDVIVEEFQSLAYMPIIRNIVTMGRGYGLRLVLCTPSLHLVDEAYSRDNPFMESCGVQLFFPSNDYAINRRLSAQTGEVWKILESWGESEGGGFMDRHGSRSRNWSQRKDQLMDGTGLANLQGLLALVGRVPYRLEPTPYFADTVWRERANLPQA